MPQVVVLQEEHKKGVLRKTMIGLGIGAAAIVALIILANVVWATQHELAIDNAKSLDKQKQYGAEMQLLQRYVATHPPQSYRYDAELMLGNVAIKTGDYHQAYQAYLYADSLSSKPNLEVKLGVAQAATAVGDKATAISYYKQAVELTPKSATEKIGELEDEIRGLGGTP